MQHFETLDTLLQHSFDIMQTEGDKVHDTAYLSSEYIQQALNEKNITLSHIEALDRLQKRLRLTEFERKIILILFAPEVDAKYERIYAYLQDNLNRTYPTVQLLTQLLCQNKEETETLYNYFIKASKFTLLHLIDIGKDEPNTVQFQQPLRLSASLRNYLLGDLYIEGTLPDYCQLISPVRETKIESDEIIQAVEKGMQNVERYLINLYGDSTKNKQEEAKKIASYFGFGLLLVDSRRALISEPDTNKLTGKLIRDALLSGSILYFEYFDLFLSAETYQESAFFTQLEQLAWLTFFDTPVRWNPNQIPKRQHFFSLKKDHSPYAQRTLYWQQKLKTLNTSFPEALVTDLVNTFYFSEEEIDNIVQLAQAEKNLGHTMSKDLILQLCRSRISSNLDQYAQHIHTPAQMEDMVLQEKTKTAIEEIMIHYRYKHTVFQTWGYDKFFQSEGLTLLFSGVSGTGKTMAASVIANTLGLELYKIDLSQMISKYIGETEKNLAKLFEAAKESGVILFFDEADAVFGKRTELKDSHDRYANIEVSYLLQRIEEYEGIVILASNFKENIDEAFLRRLRFVIDFPTPDAKQREALWQKLLPKRLIETEIPLTEIAERFKLSGANIRNIALYAAFNAAGEGRKIASGHLKKALQNELEKSGVSLEKNDLDFLGK